MSGDSEDEMLDMAETLKMLDRMHELAREDEEAAEAQDDEKQAEYWEGFGDALFTLRQHIRTGVKVSCFPVGNCECHPFKINRPEPGTRWWNWLWK